MPSVELPAAEQQQQQQQLLDGDFFGGNAQARTRLRKPLRYAGTLDSFKNQDLTPVVGREYEGLQVKDLLRWGDDMIRDLAVTSEYLSLSLSLYLCPPARGTCCCDDDEPG